MSRPAAVRSRRRARGREPKRVVRYADGEQASGLAQMLGGLIDANVQSHPALVHDADEAVTLDFESGEIVVHNGLRANRKVTISAQSATLMNLSLMRPGPFGIPMLTDEPTRQIGLELLTGRLRIDGLPVHAALLTRLTRLFSVG